MPGRKQNYYQEPRSTSRDEFRRLQQSKDLASSRIDQLAMLPLAEKKVLIRQLLIEVGTDVDQNDSDPAGDGGTGFHNRAVRRRNLNQQRWPRAW